MSNLYHSFLNFVSSQFPDVTSQYVASISLVLGLILFSTATALLHLAGRRSWNARERSLLRENEILRKTLINIKTITKDASLSIQIESYVYELSLSTHLSPYFEAFDKREDQPVPPAMAERLLRFVTKPRYQESLIGDRNERFNREVEKYGEKRARRLYWSDTLASLSPLLRAKAKKWGIIAAVIEFTHYLIRELFG